MARMKVVQISKPRGDFEIVERNIPDPGPFQVRIKVVACGVCHSDSVVKDGVFPIQYPRVPGHEIAGRIDAVGAGVTNWKEGQRVGVGWHGGHCFQCEPCRRGDFVLCKFEKITCVTHDGGYAEYMIAPAESVVHVVQVWEIVVLAALLGVVNAFDVPARQSFLIEMVVREDLMNAIALNSSMFNGARVIGPAIAGILVARIGEGWCFFANAVSYIAVIIGLLMMKLGPLRTASKDSSPFEHIAEGFRFVRRTKPILTLVLLIGLVSLVAVPYSVLMPIFADRVLHRGAHGLGILMGSTGIGALLGALTLAIRRGVQGLGRVVGLSAGGFGVSLILFAFSRYFWLSVVLLVPVGYGVMLQMSSSNTLIQAMVPDELRGRAMAMYTMMFMGMAPLGSLFAGALADKIGAPWTVAIGGLGAIAGAVVFLRRLPSLRFEAQQLIVAQGLSPAEPSKDIAAG